METRVGCILVLALVALGCEETHSVQQFSHRTANARLSTATPPCSARNPVALLDATIERTRGAPNEHHIPFSLSGAASVCVRIDVPSVDGHRVTAGEVALNGETLLRSSDFQQDLPGAALTRSLASGAHSVFVRVASKPGTQVRVRIEVAGPVIDSISPLYGPEGTLVAIQGEGFVAPFAVHAGNVALPTAGSADESSTVVTTVASMPVAGFTITTPFGSATSQDVFVPDDPVNVVQFYPIPEYELNGGTCSGGARLRVRHDSSRVGFVLVDSQPSDSFTLDVDLDREPLTIERQLTSTRVASTSVVSATIEALDLNSHVTLGRLSVRVRTRGPCGERQSQWVDVKSAFAPGLVIVRTASPATLSQRHGLTLVTTEGDLSLMQIPSGLTLDDTLVALGRDPESMGAIPDPVLYNATHATRTTCTVAGQVHDLGAGAFSQWNLDRIGIVAHPSPLAGVGVVVAVADSGFTPNADSPAAFPGLDFTIFGDGTTADVDAPTSASAGFHGTGVASVIAAPQGNGGIVGLAPGATILPLRVMGATGAGEGFGLFRAFNAVLTIRAAGGNVQVVNVSMAEFLDSIALWTGIADRLARFSGISPVALTAGLVIGSIIRTPVRLLNTAGVAVVASSGNIPACAGGGTACVENRLIAAAGPQFPANAPGAFAIAATDALNAPSTISMPASLFAPIAIAAPVDDATGTGAGAVPAFIPGGMTCFGGTSAAAPQVSGAIAHLLAPAPPATPVGVTGVFAMTRLLETATPLAAPRTSVGAGLLNLSAASQPPAVWSFDFQTTSGRINDLTFMPGVGDFALRNSGSVIETIPAPGGNVSSVLTGLPGATSLTAVPGLRLLLLGFPDRVEVRSAGGALIQTRAVPTFRPAVASVSPSTLGELVVVSGASGNAEILRAQPLVSLVTLAPEVAGERYLEAVWAGEPGASTHQTLALRTATRIELFRVPSLLVSPCGSQPQGCPVRMGSISLTETGRLLAVTDFTVVERAGGTLAYVVNGSSSVFIGSVAAGVFTATGVGSQSWSEVESSPASTKVYVADRDAPAIAILQGAAILQVDTTRVGVPRFRMNGAFRFAPTATYAYAAGSEVVGPNEAWAVTFAGLAP